MSLQGGSKQITSNNQPVISVIIVTYNAAATLEECIDSIVRQTYPAIELIVIDGQSKDDTVDILKRNDQLINFWLSEPDKGIYDAMNKALHYITGDWLYFIGADDALFDDFSKLAGELKDPTAIYYSRVLCTGGPTFPVQAYQFSKIGICHQAMIYPKSVFDKSRFNLKYPISADYAFNMALFNSGKYHFQFKDYLIARFNDTGVSSTSIDQAFEEDRSGLVYKYFGLKIWLRFMFWRLKRKLRS